MSYFNQAHSSPLCKTRYLSRRAAWCIFRVAFTSYYKVYATTVVNVMKIVLRVKAVLNLKIVLSCTIYVKFTLKVNIE